MKKITLLSILLCSLKTFSQYSSYYNLNAKVNANINQNITGTITENKTITTIDYGSLAMANAQREKNAIDLQRIQDDRARQIALSIAEDPLKAFDFGFLATISTRDKKMFNDKEILKSYQETSGFKNFKIDYQLPNSILFSPLDPLHFQNISKDGVKTEVYILLPTKLKENDKLDIEDYYNSFDTLVGKEFEEPDDNDKIRKIFYHKNTLSRATVLGRSGYRNTTIWEDKFEYCITDNYSVVSTDKDNKYSFNIKVRCRGDKSEVNFEKLEGRRYYFRQLIEKIASTARVSELQALN